MSGLVNTQEIIDHITYSVTVGYSREAREYMRTFEKSHPLLSIPEEFLRGVVENAMEDTTVRFNLDHNIRITADVIKEEVTYPEPY